MIHIKSVLERVTPFTAATALLMASTVPTLMLMGSASADPLTDRSLMVTSTVASNDLLAPDNSSYVVTGPGALPAGDPRNGQRVGHTYEFNVGQDGDLNGFTIEYCETAFGFVGDGACSASDLLDTTTGGVGFTAINWDEGTVEVNGVDFDVEANAANYLTLTPATTGVTGLTAGDTVTIEFPADATNYFVNPNSDYKTTSNGTYFAHISTFDVDTNANGAFAHTGGTPAPGIVDDGTVTNNITTAIGIYTRVQETLNFSVEGHLATDAAGPSSTYTPGDACTALNRQGRLTMGDTNSALSASDGYDALSYFRLATNSANGVSVFYSGDTLKAGPNAIDQIGTSAVVSTPGDEQFGLAFDSTATGHSLTGGGVGTPGLNPIAAYASGNGTIGTGGSPGTAQFAFDAGSVTQPAEIAQSDGVVACDTGAVRYVANIATDTPAGIYQTKINYIASPSY